MRQHILSLLASDSLVDYLEGIQLFAEAIRTRALAQREIDSELMERAAAVVAMEGWAQHDDYISKLEHFIDQMPQFADLISRDDAQGHAFKGIVIFINGIAQGKLNTEGFPLAGAASGWALCKLAGAQLQRYYEAEGRFMDGVYFRDLSEWFGAIDTAQEEFLQALEEIQDWSESSANGFFNILPMAAPAFQARLLKALKNAKHLPTVQTGIFDRYLDVLNTTRQGMVDADEPGQATEVDHLIDMVLDARGN